MFYQFNHLGSPDYLKIEKGKNFNFSAHLHRCFEIIIILSGQMNVNVDNKTFLLEKNQAVLIFPNQIHSLSSQESEHILCIFSPDLIKAYSNKTNGKVPVNCTFTPDSFLINALNRFDINSNICEKKDYYTSCVDNSTKLHFIYQHKNIRTICFIKFLLMLKIISTVIVHWKNFPNR